MGLMYSNVAHKGQVMCLPLTSQQPQHLGFLSLTGYSIYLGQTEESFRADEVQNMRFSPD